MQENTGCCLGGWLGFLGLFGGLFLCVFNLFLGILVIIGSIVLGVVIAYAPIHRENKEKAAYQEGKARNVELAKGVLHPQYDAAYQSMGVPENCRTVSSKGYPDLYCWIADGTLKFLTEWQHVEWIIEHNVGPETNVESLTLFDFYCYSEQIPLDRILHFQREGELYTETRVQGGGRATARIYPNSSTSSVIDLPEIKTETVEHDERATVLHYYEDDSHTQTGIHCYTYDAYHTFLALMPDKEYSRLVAVEAAAAGRQGGDLKARLEELKSLRDSDLITQEEYEEKKEELLKEL